MFVNLSASLGLPTVASIISIITFGNDVEYFNVRTVVSYVFFFFFLANGDNIITSVYLCGDKKKTCDNVFLWLKREFFVTAENALLRYYILHGHSIRSRIR